MKLNCNKPSYDEYKSIKTAKRKAKEAAEYELYMKMKLEGEVVFAWLPKVLRNGTCVWLERVRRKCISSDLNFKYKYIHDDRDIWEYTAL